MPEAIALVLLNAFAVEATAVAVAVTSALVSVALSVGLSVLAQSFLAPAAPKAQAQGVAPSDRQFISRNSVAPRLRSYGRVRVAGVQVFEGAFSGALYRVLAHNDGKIDAIEEHVIDERIVTLDSDGFVENTYDAIGTLVEDKAHHQIQIKWRTGDDSQTYYEELFNAYPEWDSTHKGNAVAHSLTIFTQGRQSAFFEIFPQANQTSYKVTIRASRVWDMRDDTQVVDDPETWKWSDNAALVILDHLRHKSGLNMTMKWIEPELESWRIAANHCDENIIDKDGFVQNRYRIWGTYSYDERPGDVLHRMLTACNGRFWVGSNGGLALSVGVWTTPTVTIDGDAIVAYKIGSGNEAPDTANTLSAVYTERDQGFVEVDAAPWVDEAAVLTFGEQRSDAKLYMVPSHNQCRRLMKQAFYRLSPEHKGTITTNLRGLAALSERYIRLVISELELDIYVEIDNIRFRIEKGSVVTGLYIDFTSISSTVFDFDSAVEEGSPSEPAPTIENSSIPVPVNFNVLIENRGSNVVGVCSWVAPSIPTLKTRITFSDLTTEGSDSVVDSSEGATSVETGALVAGDTYRFYAVHQGLLRGSDATSDINRDIVVDTVAPGVPTALSTSKSLISVTVGWTNPASAGTYGARIYRNVVNNPATATLAYTKYGAPSAVDSWLNASLPDGTYWWWVATINGSGVESARTLAGTETIP